MRVFLQNGMEIDCDNSEIIKIDNPISRLD
jgi:hypothetical protein